MDAQYLAAGETGVASVNFMVSAMQLQVSEFCGFGLHGWSNRRVHRRNVARYIVYI